MRYFARVSDKKCYYCDPAMGHLPFSDIGRVCGSFFIGRENLELLCCTMTYVFAACGSRTQPEVAQAQGRPRQPFNLYCPFSRRTRQHGGGNRGVSLSRASSRKCNEHIMLCASMSLILSQELRELIYFYSIQPVPTYKTAATPAFANRTIAPAFFQLCRAVRAESLQYELKYRPVEISLHSLANVNLAQKWALEPASHASEYRTYVFTGGFQVQY